ALAVRTNVVRLHRARRPVPIRLHRYIDSALAAVLHVLAELPLLLIPGARLVLSEALLGEVTLIRGIRAELRPDEMAGVVTSLAGYLALRFGALAGADLRIVTPVDDIVPLAQRVRAGAVRLLGHSSPLLAGLRILFVAKLVPGVVLVLVIGWIVAL